MICDSTPKIDIRRYKSSPPFEQIYFKGRAVQIVSTQCHFGGKRWWFLCPRCGRRCAILYPRLCRVCENGRYRSELESPENRLITKAIRLRRRLGQQKGGVVAPFPPKPKHMHWSTYLRIRREAREIEAKIWRNASTRTARHRRSAPSDRVPSSAAAPSSHSR